MLRMSAAAEIYNKSRRLGSSRDARRR